MQNSVATLICSNPRCQATNTEHDQFCQQCGTPLAKHYLWAVGPTVDSYNVGDALTDRFIFRGYRVVLDTEPGTPLQSNLEIPESALPYMKLFPYRLHIPQIYTLLSGKGEEGFTLLLEGGPLPATTFQLNHNSHANPSNSAMPVGPSLTWGEAWPLAPPLRQLNWLWQMAQLWPPLCSQRVATSLLTPPLLYTEGSLFRLLALQQDGSTEPKLSELGQLWQQWLPHAQEAIASELETLCQQLISAEVQSAEQLLGQLEQTMVKCQQSYRVQIDIATRTDTGPMRDHNEDACYPSHGTVVHNSPERLAIVCDGVGGHAGGEVASGIAIAALQKHITKLSLAALSPAQIITELEEATCEANDLIAQQNDQEQRQDRERMGTTLVMALAQAHQLYITHVGDSRVYLINARGCYQVTVDDDIASREVRLGYNPYRSAIQQPVAGSLIQALGMASSSILRPTVQRLILDEDCIFLLCSDGLSDYDRVEMLWRDELLPLLTQQTDLGTVSNRLIELANQLNGHDNVTIDILHCRVAPQSGTTEVAPEQPENATLIQDVPTHPDVLPSIAGPPTQVPPPQRKWLLLLLEVLLLCGLLGALAYFFLGHLRSRETTPSVNSSPSPEATIPLDEFWLGSILQIGPEPGATTFEAKPIPLWLQTKLPKRLTDETSNQIALSNGNLIQVTAAQKVFYPVGGQPDDAFGRQVRWLQIRTCRSSVNRDSLPQLTASPRPLQPNQTSTSAAAQPGLSETPAPESLKVGWVKARDLVPLVAQKIPPSQLTLAHKTACSPQPTTGQSNVGANDTSDTGQGAGSLKATPSPSP